MIPDIYWKRQHTLLCSNDKFNGAPHVFLSKFDATMNEVPEGFDEFPMFPGIDPEKIKGKRFETLGILTNKMSIIVIFGHNFFKTIIKKIAIVAKKIASQISRKLNLNSSLAIDIHIIK